MTSLRASLAALLAVAGTTAASAQTLDKVSFGTNWVAEAEHGGYYQAVADGTYKKYGSTSRLFQAAPTSTIASCCRSAKSTSS